MGWPGPMTHRQYLAWEAWYEATKYEPELNEFYIAQACAEIRRVMSSSPSSIKIEDFILEFKEKGREYTEKEKKTFSDAAKIHWSRKMGMPIKVIPKEEAVYVYPSRHPDHPRNRNN